MGHKIKYNYSLMAFTYVRSDTHTKKKEKDEENS